MTTFYAKPDQTYSEHIEAVFYAWIETIEAKKQLIERFSKLYCFSPERFLKSSLLTVVLHDIGKMIPPFQNMMNALRNGKRYNSHDNYRHELVSFVFTAFAASILFREECLTYAPLEALAVVGHHRPINTDLTSFEREKTVAAPPIIRKGFNEAIELAIQIYKRYTWSLPILKNGLEKDNPYNRLANLLDPVNNYFGKLLSKDGYEKARDIYILLKGILHYADWHASGKTKVNYCISISPDKLIEKLAEHCKKKGITFSGLRPFQIKMGKCSGHLLAIAPTGSGKTEGSLLWALNNIKEMGSAKIIYLLPTMNTANQIWSRLSNIFGVENVGLTHSTANLFMTKEIGEDESESWENRRNLLFDESFIRPVTVGTVDQLLTSGFNAGHWTVKEVNTANAVIIMDEIHAYDGWTLGLIISCIRHFVRLGSRFLLMSATIPQRLIELIRKELSPLIIVKDEALLLEARSVYQVIDKYIEDDEEKIRDAVISGYRILVVVNTIEKCQALTNHFKDLHPLCYHSRFTLKDRKRIEEKINESSFIIATQVVEVSLDMDYDWLFTECAPPDAVIQRAGRVNRYRDPNRDSRVYIYKPSIKAEEIYNPINDPELLERSYRAFVSVISNSKNGRLSELNLNDIVQEVYRDFKIEETIPYKDAICVYEKIQKKRMAVLDSRLDEDEQEVTRRSDYNMVSVIPLSYFEVIDLPPKDRRWYEVKIPLWYFKKNKKVYRGLFFCNMKYDDYIGAILEPESNII